MKKLTLLVFCLALAVGSGWAGVVGTTDPSLFNDTVDWCQYGCGGASYASPQSWISNGGATGEIGLVGTLQGFYNLQQDSSWLGNFAPSMGLVYNGAAFGNTPAPIAATFDTGLFGAGAYIQSDYYGPFTATIELFDVNDLSLGTYTVGGTSAYSPGTALFIGAFGSAPVYAAQFYVTDQFGNQDFAIGSLLLSTSENLSPSPEPGTFLLLGSSALGLAGVLRRRFKGVL